VAESGLRQAADCADDHIAVLDPVDPQTGDIPPGLDPSSEVVRQFQRLVEHIPGIAAYMDVVRPDDPGTSIPVYISPQIEQLLGYPREAWLNEEELWPQVLHPDDAERLIEAALHARTTLSPLFAEYRIIHRDGHVVWMSEKAAVVEDESTGTVYWQGVMVDITERKRAEEALREAEERFRVAFDDAPIGIALLTPEGRWFHVNPALCTMLGYKEDELIERTVFDLTHPDDVDSSRERIEGRLRGEARETRAEKRYVRSDGEVVWAAVNSSVARDAAGQPLYIVVQIEDITQRRRSQKALQEAEERFRRAFDDAPIGMALVAPDGHWLRVNRTICEITGYSEAELLGGTFQDITHPDDLDRDVEQVGRMIAGEIRSYQMEKRYLRPDGGIVWVMLSVSLVRDDAGEPLYFLSQIEDINERKRAEHELQRLAEYDSLTGLGNRHKLMADLDRVLVMAPDRKPRLLIILDLNGFKHYNDSFGHPAGDAVLARLAAKLAVTTKPYGDAYRLGGDEFCVLAAPPPSKAETFLDAIVAALHEKGEGFHISSSFGAVFVPEEASDPESALSLADQRLYAQKHVLYERRGEPHEILLQALWEHEPSLREHVEGVASLSVAVGSRLGLGDQALEELRLAAELHDIGKLALPDALLQKPGPLSKEEWEFLRQHTVIGQRILAGVPALRTVGEIVRATHERWDGTGYVDGLAGTEIPLAARIIAVCDAYVAMTSHRPYREALTGREAVAELRRCASTQFDPDVVRAACAELTTGGSTPARTARAPESA
jgi:PAS domain S-box-containing protein/diguanylate cyclase (GGDEF)-like protein